MKSCDFLNKILHIFYQTHSQNLYISAFYFFYFYFVFILIVEIDTILFFFSNKYLKLSIFFSIAHPTGIFKNQLYLDLLKYSLLTIKFTHFLYALSFEKHSNIFMTIIKIQSSSFSPEEIALCPFMSPSSAYPQSLATIDLFSHVMVLPFL